MTRLILHLGDHKTGTSSLQRTMAAGPMPDGWIYPVAGRANGVGHHNLAWAIGNDPRFRPAKGGWPQMWSEAAQTAHTGVVISSEGFEFKKPAKVVTQMSRSGPIALSYIEAILYIRPHKARLMASFAERLKRGIGPFDRAAFLDQALTSGQFHFAARIRQWRRALSPHPLSLRIFDRSSLKAGDIVDDFYHYAFGVAPPQIRPSAANASPNADQLDYMRIQGQKNTSLRDAKFARQQSKNVRDIASCFADGPPPVWSEAEQKRILAACHADAAELDHIFGGDFFTNALMMDVENPCYSAGLNQSAISTRQA